MATNFPASLDTLTNPTSSDSLSSPSHSAQHANVNDAVEALQAKVGADSSAVTSSLDYRIAQLEAISHGKILQVVRATDTTNRTTTSTSLVDANLSVTITPTAATSTVLLIATADVSPNANDGCYLAITDSSNVAISGGERYAAQDLSSSGQLYRVTAIAYDSPATTSATTYKLRFRSALGGSATLQNGTTTAQMFAIEVSS